MKDDGKRPYWPPIHYTKQQANATQQEFDALTEELNNMRIQYEAATQSRDQFKQLAADFGYANEKLTAENIKQQEKIGVLQDNLHSAYESHKDFRLYAERYQYLRDTLQFREGAVSMLKNLGRTPYDFDARIDAAIAAREKQ
jgi:hypothetical protein